MISYNSSPLKPHQDHALMTELWDPEVAENPEKFVLFAFPWGKEGSALERESIRTWQRDELQAMTEHIQNNRLLMEMGKEPRVFKSATVSGRGVGKSSLVAWLTLWNMSCNLGSSTIVTANSEPQLKTKTWPELGNWYTILINKHWFELSTMALKPSPWFEKALDKRGINAKYYFAQALLWSEENPDSFAGHHNKLGTMVFFDEASGIPEPIWNVTKGYFTEPVLHRYHCVFSNGRRNTGPFYECFHANRSFWRRRHLDSRDVEGTDKTVLNEIILEKGEDSDVARVEVKGMFPRQGDNQFISRELVEDALLRELIQDPWAPIVMGVDPARFGDDEFVIRFRQGRDGRSFPVIVKQGIDTGAAVALCAHWIDKVKPDAVCVDAGNGTGVIDGLRDIGFKVHEVWFGAKSTKEEYANKRTEMWADMRDWLRGACIDDHADLRSDLPGPEYYFPGNSDVIGLEPKEKMKKRGLSSPNHADALACTFAVKVPRRDNALNRKHARRNNQVASGMDYDVFGR